MKKSYKSLLALCIIPLAYSACEDEYNFNEPVRAFEVAPAFSSIDEGASLQLTATSGGQPVAVTWSSDNSAIVNVTAAGVATGVAPGITGVIAALASDPTQTGSTTITVNALQGISLTKGVPVTGLSGATGNQKLYRIFVPAGTTNLTVTLAGGPGDADIYVQRATPPTTSVAAFFSFNAGNGELVSVNNPASGTWYILVDAFSAYSGATLTATYTP